jgi:hypothetical protein
MSAEIDALLDKPHLLVLVLGLGALIGWALDLCTKVRGRPGRHNSRWSGRQTFRGSTERLSLRVATGNSAPDAADQLRTVMGADFQSRPLLNRAEGRLFDELERIVREVAPEWRVMAQVSLGEILASESSAAYSCINSKRVDVLLVDSTYRPLHAIEYQGTGHHQGSAAARDAVKKEALRRAAIGYLEIVPGDTPAELRRVIERLVARRPLQGQQAQP